jgi:hypothetical protein
MSLTKVRWDPIDQPRNIQSGFFPDHDADALTVVHKEDVEFILKKNQEMYNASSSRFAKSVEWKLWASLPPIFWHKFKAEYGLDLFKNSDWPKIRALLHQPEFRKLRTAPGTYQGRPTRHYPTTRRSGVVSKIGAGQGTVRRGSFGAS